MKLNGALKPRQGASTKGSSPGVVLKKYRIKRCFKVNENVINGLPLKTCGVKNKDLTENIINGYFSNNSNQHQTTTPLIHNQEQKKKCKKLCHSISSSSSRIKFSTSIKTKQQQIYFKKNYKWNRVPQITKRKVCIYNLNSSRNKNKVSQTQVAADVKTRAEEAIEKYNKKTGAEIDFGAKAVTNITTRQTKKAILNKKNQKNKTNNITKVKQEKAFKTTLNTLKNRFAFNKNHNHNHNSNSNSKNKNSTPKEVNNFFFILRINKNLNLTVTLFWRLFIQLKLLLFFMFSHTNKYFYLNPFARCGGSGRVTAVTKMMRISQFLEGSLKRICFKNARRVNSPIALCVLLYTATAIFLPHPVVGDNDDTFFPINGLETTTPEFDYASRGQKKFGDKCENTLECGFPGSICDPKKKSCQCTEDLPVTNHIDKCGKEAAVNESCFFNEQCEVKYFQTECRDHRCVCRFDMTPVWLKDGSVECKGRGDKKGPETYVDPAMIGVLIGMALMFIIICVVLRLFSQARWRENRTIFNTPNPRLMNVSLLRESKLLHGQERRGSRMSVRAPSRQPSMASLRPHSPNPSLGKTGSRSNSHGSNASGTSLRSTRSNSVSPAGIINGNNSHHERKGSTYQPHQHQHPQQQKLQSVQQEEQQPLTQTNIIPNPVAETVTVEIIEPENK